MSPPPHYIKQLVQPDVIPLPPLRQVRSLPKRNSAAPSGNRVEWRRSFWCWCLRCLNICPDSPGQRSPPHPHLRNYVTGPLGESPVWGGSGGHRLRTVWRDKWQSSSGSRPGYSHFSHMMWVKAAAVSPSLCSHRHPTSSTCRELMERRKTPQPVQEMRTNGATLERWRRETDCRRHHANTPFMVPWHGAKR